MLCYVMLFIDSLICQNVVEFKYFIFTGQKIYVIYLDLLVTRHVVNKITFFNHLTALVLPI